MLVFDVAQFDGILKKITEFNNALLSDQVGSLFLLLHKVGYSRGKNVEQCGDNLDFSF